MVPKNSAASQPQRLGQEIFFFLPHRRLLNIWFIPLKLCSFANLKVFARKVDLKQYYVVFQPCLSSFAISFCNGVGGSGGSTPRAPLCSAGGTHLSGERVRQRPEQPAQGISSPTASWANRSARVSHKAFNPSRARILSS